MGALIPESLPWSPEFRRNPLARFTAPPAPRPDELANGCIFMLPGIESGRWQLNHTVRGLRDAGIDQAISALSWGLRPFGSIPNLVAYARNRKRATRIAGVIARYAETYPQRPITLLGYSGGGGLAILIAEALPAPIQLDALILMAPALSPGYNLSAACIRCKGSVINFHSPRDSVMLGAGTRVFGTIDRQYQASGGRCGFTCSEPPPNLLQISWRDEWNAFHHNGGHFGWLSHAWSKNVLAPHIPAIWIRPRINLADEAPLQMPNQQ